MQSRNFKLNLVSLKHTYCREEITYQATEVADIRTDIHPDEFLMISNNEDGPPQISQEVHFRDEITGSPMIVSMQQALAGVSDRVVVESVNDWNTLNVNTVTSWRNNIAKTSFIYGVLLKKEEQNLERSLLLTLICGTIMTLLAALSITLGPLGDKWIVLAFDAVILVGSATVTISNGLIKIFNWDDNVKKLTQVIEKLDAMWYVFETELNIPPSQRQNGKDFVKRLDSEYAHLMQQCPHIDMEQYMQASQEYQTRLSKNLIWQYQFNRQMRTELRQVNP